MYDHTAFIIHLQYVSINSINVSFNNMIYMLPPRDGRIRQTKWFIVLFRNNIFFFVLHKVVSFVLITEPISDN